jgi:hypothetical protein
MTTPAYPDGLNAIQPPDTDTRMTEAAMLAAEYRACPDCGRPFDLDDWDGCRCDRDRLAPLEIPDDLPF